MLKPLFLKSIIRRSNELAMRARGQTDTNPNVGAIVFDRDHKILGEGWHKSFGGPHAEIYAIEQAKGRNSIAGQSIAISLEPCNHTGKTPACTKAIIENKLSEVVIDQIDPDPRMSGQSIKLMKEMGLVVRPPLESGTGERVLHPFYISNRYKRPFLRLKMAISMDYFIGKPGRRVIISNGITNRWVHRLRTETQAIMAGTNTLLNDNPSLSARYHNRFQPIRIIPDKRGILPRDLKIFVQPGQNIVLTQSERKDYPATIIHTSPHNLRQTFSQLYQYDIGSILIEGGSQLFTSLLNQNLWDELIIIQNTKLFLGSGVLAPSFPSVYPYYKIKLGTDSIRFIKNLTSR